MQYEYLGKDPVLTPWRDTHVKLEGPVVQEAQFCFIEDWYWATNGIPELNWQLQKAEDGDEDILMIASGPADNLETCGLMFVQAINDARQRVWIASPYFVPDEGIINALQLAEMRGVDVRILIPDKPDHLLVYVCLCLYRQNAQVRHRDLSVR